MTNYLSLSVKEINGMLKNKEIKPIDLVEECFINIEKNKHLNGFITTMYEEAKSKALELENMEVDNLLFGIPIVIKDNISTLGVKTTCASLMLDNYIPIYDAFVVEKIKEANMIIVGKANMDEFAMGSSNQTSYYGNVLNPINNSLTPGGSSGGCASLVGAGVVNFSIGSDTGGSIRQPASFCGIVGMKPSYGTVSRNGLIAFASSLDQIGPMTNDVYNNALLLNLISSFDDNDYTKSNLNIDYTSLIGKDIKGLKVAIPSYYISDVIDEVVREKINLLVEYLRSLEVVVDIVDINSLSNSVLLYEIIGMSEACSNLSRYDGVKYGYSSLNYSSSNELYEMTRSEGFGDEVKRRIMIGTYLLSGDNKDIYYNKALKLRDQMSKELNTVLSNYDFIIGPTTTSLPYELGKENNDELKAFYDDILTIPANLSGLPAISIPIGYVDKLPVGLQIMSGMNKEDEIYRLASYIEKNYKEMM